MEGFGWTRYTYDMVTTLQHHGSTYTPCARSGSTHQEGVIKAPLNICEKRFMLVIPNHTVSSAGPFTMMKFAWQEFAWQGET